MWEFRCGYLGIVYGKIISGNFTNQMGAVHRISPTIRKTMGMNVVTGY